MRIVPDEGGLVRALPLAQAEADAAFGNGEVYLERFIDRPRHIEVQVLADNFGNVLAVGERDCSIQRRHQKLVEEAPAPNLARKTRDALLTAAVKGAKAARYTNAGTLEFLVDPDGSYYFMEMNTRIQVEHPVTEMTTGIDLVAWQIRIAAGQRLTLTHRDREPRGHAIECRITAEDATSDFAPSVGTVEMYVAPGGPGVRVDSHLYAGYSVPPYYDSLLGKIIAWGRDREEAAARMERALTETVITGVPQTVSFLRSMVADHEFRAATYDTGFVSRFVERQLAATNMASGDDAAIADG
jgi:acetyl-CoA carboxylase biotin carboxylase subunit